MKSLVALIAFLTVFINFSSCNKLKCKESSFTPCDNFDIKKIVGRWYYLSYDDGAIGVSTCDYSDITYIPCKDKYSIKYHRFNKDDEEETREGWIDIPSSDDGILDIKYTNGEQRAFVIEVDYKQYLLARGCYNNKSYSLILLRDKKLDKKLKKKVTKLIEEYNLGKELYYGPECGY